MPSIWKTPGYPIGLELPSFSANTLLKNWLVATFFIWVLNKFFDNIPDTAGEVGTQLISDVLQWTSAHGQAKVGRPARTYIQRLRADTGCNLEDFPGVMHDRDG